MMLLALALIVLPPLPSPSSTAPDIETQAQGAAPAPSARLRVFLDCDCFADYIRTAVTFVDYVRDRESADVHVLGRSRETGGSGREYSLHLVGIGRFQGSDLDLRAVTTASDTEDTRRRAVESALEAGLLAYLAKAGLPAAFTIDVDAGDAATPPAPADDPWNFWVYALSASGELDAEESSREWRWGVSASADRVTEHWKMSVGLSANETREEFDLDEDEPVTSRRHSRRVDVLMVKSLGPHWSAGATGEVGSSSFDNLQVQASIAPAIEFSFFPYEDYARRQLTATYSIGPRYHRYYEETIFGKTRETRGRHDLALRFDQREPWGTLEAGIEASQYLPATDQYRIAVDSEISIRVVRGLSVSFEARASRLRDQIALPNRGATDEEVLLRLRQLRSGYEYRFDVGFTYTFGSIFNSVVNPRFGGGDNEFRR